MDRGKYVSNMVINQNITNDLKVVHSTMETSLEIDSIEYSICISGIFIFMHFSYNMLIIQAKITLSLCPTYSLFFYTPHKWTYY